MTSIKCVLFDLGGVLIELDGPPLSPSASRLSERDIWQGWLNSVAVRRYESGLCDIEEFATTLIREMDLELSTAQLISQFEQWPKGLYQGALEILEGLKPGVHLACLSNTNELHWRRFDHQGRLTSIFDTILTSFETGMMKPDAEAYQHAIKTTGFEPAEILFLDDNELNISAARDNGIRAELTRGPSQAKQHLKQHGLL